MPISTLHKRKCRLCGKSFYVCIGDCITMKDIMNLNRSICDECRWEIHDEVIGEKMKKKGFPFF